MSHLSILPTVFTDLERLVQALCDEGFTVERSTELQGFADDSHAVDVLAFQGSAMPLGWTQREDCLLYTSPSPRDRQKSRMPSSA